MFKKTIWSQDLVPQTELKEKITEFCKKHGIVMGNESSNVPSPTKKTPLEAGEVRRVFFVFY